MEKAEETAETVTYRFGFQPPITGLVSIDRATGGTEIVSGSEWQGRRAAVRLRQCWEASSFPDATDYRA